MARRFQMPSLRDEITVTMASNAYLSSTINVGGMEAYALNMPIMTGITAAAPTFTAGFMVWSNSTFTQFETSANTIISISTTTGAGVLTLSDTLRGQLRPFPKWKLRATAADTTTGASQFAPRTFYVLCGPMI